MNKEELKHLIKTFAFKQEYRYLVDKWNNREHTTEKMLVELFSAIDDDLSNSKHVNSNDWF